MWGGGVWSCLEPLRVGFQAFGFGHFRPSELAFLGVPYYKYSIMAPHVSCSNYSGPYIKFRGCQEQVEPDSWASATVHHGPRRLGGHRKKEC